MKSNKPLVFVLGDFGTGTQSVYDFLCAAGFDSIYHSFKEGSPESFSRPNGESDISGGVSWERVNDMVRSSGFNAFTNYPVRVYYSELMTEHADAYFILTTRADIETWTGWMEKYRSKFGIELDIDRLAKDHIESNERIRQMAAQTGIKLCEICIDEPSAESSKTLSRFLGLDKTIHFDFDTAMELRDPRIWSSSPSLFGWMAGDIVEYVQQSCAPHKGMLSEFGWVFLVNDGADYLNYLFGNKNWSEAETERVFTTFETRRRVLKELGANYFMFVVPEKSAVYPEYLPKIFHSLTPDDRRPAQVFSDKKLTEFSYLADILNDAKSRGLLYFKGDSHANWLGAFFIYSHIADKLNATFDHDKRRPAIELCDLVPSLAGYDGDIAGQISEDHAKFQSSFWKRVSPARAFEHLIKYDLPENIRKAKPVEVTQVYSENLGERPIFAFEQPDKSLPSAVIFRDSTSEFIVDLLAEHFSRCVFIWHKGQVYEDIIHKEKPDIVLHIVAERFFTEHKNFSAFNKVLPDGTDNKKRLEAASKNWGRLKRLFGS